MRGCAVKRLPAFFSLGLALALTAATASENWPRFRDPTGAGHHVGAALPTKWGAEDILWRVELKGDGHSSPVNWGERIFLTAATDQGSNRLVLALDARDGKLLWEKAIPCEAPERTHGMNSFATPTCVTDGERVIAFFDRAGAQLDTRTKSRKGRSRIARRFNAGWAGNKGQAPSGGMALT